MNKHCFRIIFNRTTGLLTAVSEMARVGGSNTSDAIGDGVRCPATSAGLCFRYLAIALLCGGMHVVRADIIADQQASPEKRPVVNQTASVPVVQITRPNGAGVSHNQYQQFNIDQQGAVLANNPGFSNSHLAGTVAPNPKLSSTGPAKIIVNEVTSVNPSVLNGYLEVAGQHADVIISNPNGIRVGNFGFINAQRGVLTTGVPMFGGTGSLEAFRVNTGDITVTDNAQVNDAASDQVDLIARSVAINGKVWTNKINVVTGANTVAYQDLGVTVIEGQGNKPTVAIDVAQFGGMYANKIMLVGTEEGVGVNHQGELIAKAGDFVLNAKGDVVVNGVVCSTGNMHIAGAKVAVSQQVFSHKNINVDAVQTLDVKGGIAAKNAIALHSGQTMDIHADVVAEGDIAMRSLAGIVHAAGTVASKAMMTITAATSLQNMARMYAGEMTIDAKTGIVNSGSEAVLYSRSKAYIGTALLTNEQGALLASDAQMVISAHVEDSISHSQQVINRGATINVGGNLTLLASKVDNITSDNTAAQGGDGWLSVTGSGTRYGAGGREYGANEIAIRDNGHYRYLVVLATGENFNSFSTINYTSDKQQSGSANGSSQGVIKVQNLLNYYGENLNNDKSVIQVGGRLTINDRDAVGSDAYHQIDGGIQAVIHDVGTSQFHTTKTCGAWPFDKRCNDDFSPVAYTAHHDSGEVLHTAQLAQNSQPDRVALSDPLSHTVDLSGLARFASEAAPVLSYFDPLPLYYDQAYATNTANGWLKQHYLAGQQAKARDIHVDLDQQYRDLIAAGVAFGKKAGLTSGQTLSAPQKAALPQDIIWLVSQIVTMPNGQIVSVMAPVLFRAQ